MILERIKSEGIAHDSYLIGFGSDAAVIDPRRDCQIYIDLAQQRGLKIKYIFETYIFLLHYINIKCPIMVS